MWRSMASSMAAAASASPSIPVIASATIAAVGDDGGLDRRDVPGQRGLLCFPDTGVQPADLGLRAVHTAGGHVHRLGPDPGGIEQPAGASGECGAGQDGEGHRAGESRSERPAP